MEKIVSELNLNTLSCSGKFCGYASVFGVKDFNGDIVERGAFSEFLSSLDVDCSKMPKLLWQHNVNIPIGHFSKIFEDDYGLYVEGQILRSVKKGEEAYQLIKNKVINGLSIGYKPVTSIKIPGGRKLIKLDLIEISLVTFAANEQAKITEIKNMEEKMNLNKNKSFDEKEDQIASMENKINDLSDLLGKIEQKSQQLQIQNRRPEFSTNCSQNTNVDLSVQNFSHYITKGIKTASELKSLTTVDKESGGYLIPEPVANRIYSALVDDCVMRKIANTIKISSSALDILVDKDMANAGWSSDEEKRQDHESQKLFKISIPAHEIYSRTKATSKLLEDVNIDIEKWIISKVTEKFSALESHAFVNGDGNNRPKGFLSYETSIDYEFGKIQEIKTGVKGNFAPSNASDCLIETIYSLKPQYLPNACWLMSRSVLAEIRKMKDKTTGRYLWQPGVSVKEPSTLLGYPVEICDDMPSLKDGVPSKSVAFGNFKVAYQIVDRSGIRVLRDPFSAKPFIEFYITKRVGGDVVNFEAIKILNFNE